MPDYTDKSSLPSPTMGVRPSIPTDIQDLAEALDGIVIPKYANATAMSAANPSPTAGDICYRTDLKCHMTYSAATSSWRVSGLALFGQGVTSSIVTEIVIGSIPQSATSLQLEIHGHSQEATADSFVQMRLNNVSSTIYSEFAISTWQNTSPSRIYNSSLNAVSIGVLPGTSNPSHASGTIKVFLPHYSDSNFNLNWRCESYSSNGSTGARWIDYRGTMNNYKAAVTEIRLIIPTGFTVGTRWSLYGLP